MATIVLSAVGSAVGAYLGGPIGGAIGRAVGAAAGSYIDNQLFGPGDRRVSGPRVGDLRVMSGSEGNPIPRIWGRMRVAGQVIWATNFEEVVKTSTEKTSSKGGGPKTTVTEYEYFANFAVALCEGEIDRVGRVWADGKAFDISELTNRLYTGTEAQQPDSLILAKEGAGNAPAFRGTAYMVFERMPISAFGNRIPQLSFEVIRASGGAESQVRAINIIPGSTEFGYDTVTQTRVLGGGVTETENGHASATRSDWTVSIDDFAATCRNLEAAALVVAWFGDSLNCGVASLRPGVENFTKVTEPDLWRAGGASRAAAHLISQSGGGPAFGGTPSDASVARALQDLRARGLQTVFYPFILMDIPGYPWRGNISSDADKTATCAAQVQAFVGTALPAHFSVNGGEVVYSGPAEWSYRRMILHYAKLCALAGGVDGFLIGSELRGLTRARGLANSFPFVAALVTLLADVKAILPGAKVSYAADWTEYFGHQPADGTGDVFFHLDPLWAAADFIGVDMYAPLTDWRGGHQPTDDLVNGIAGGEGFEWYYADAAARQAQTRTPISDGAYGKPWVFRSKDLQSWWQNAHFNRPGGIEAAVATAWVPQSKPFWFTETGCAAVDKGANQPNAFVDAKSADSALPYFSGGARDDFMQNRFMTVVGEHWASAANPVSSVYGGKMLEPSRIFWWAWDARPFPFFPARVDTWADGVNYARGHWLNGRLSAVPLGRLIAAVCADYGFYDVDASEVEGLVDGFLIDRPMSARDALETLVAAFAIDAVEAQGMLKFRMRKSMPVLAIDDFAESDADVALFALTRAQETELPAVVRLAYTESGLDYRRGSVEARRVGVASARESSAELPCAVSQATAQARAEVALQEIWAGRATIEFALPPGRIEIEPGDVLTLSSGAFRVEQVTDGGLRKIRARSYQAAVYEPGDAPERQGAAARVFAFGAPDAVVMDLPIAGAAPHAPWIAASASPWPGQLALYRGVGSASFALNRSIDAQATKGVLLDGLAAGPRLVFDRASKVRVKLEFGALASVSEAELLRGANIAAVGGAGGWEIIQYCVAELVAADTYQVSMLLRGQSGSEPEMQALLAAGQRFVVLNGAVIQPVLSLSDAAMMQDWRLGPAQYDIARGFLNVAHQGNLRGLRPYAPCQLRARLDGGDVVFSWLRRTRIDGDGWDLAEAPLGEESEAYRFEIMAGAVVKRSVLLVAPLYRYLAADMASDFGSAPGGFDVRVAQMSAVYGRGAELVKNLTV